MFLILSSRCLYANPLGLDRCKCLLTVHAGTLFPTFVADVRVTDLRPIERRIVDLVEAALLEEGLPVDALGRLDLDDVRLAEDRSRHVLGVMNQMTFECGWHIDPVGGLWNLRVDELNHHLRRSLHQRPRVPGTARTRAHAQGRETAVKRQVTARRGYSRVTA